ETAFRFAIQSPSQPTFQPSTSTPPNPLAAAKSMYRFVFAVVAPCLGPELHVIVPMCMPHQMPTYFIGLIQLVLWMTLGGLRLRPSTDGARSVARSASWIVRHGVTNGVWPRTLIPSAIGARAARSVVDCMRGPARNMRA